MSVQIHTTRTFDESVEQGVRLYGELTQLLPKPDYTVAYRYWLAENAVAAPYFALARANSKVVGLLVLIPFRSEIGGEVVESAKEEYFVVSPEYRSVIAEGYDCAVPLALHLAAKRFAQEEGLRFCFGVPSRPASIISRMAGATMLVHSCKRHYLRLRFRRRGGSLKHKATNLVGASIVAAKQARSRWQIGRACGIEKPRLADQFAEASAVPANRLIASTPDTLAFRFPASRYLHFQCEDSAGAKSDLVFPPPTANEYTSLSHFSSLDLPMDRFCAVLGDMIPRARTARSLGLVVDAAEDQLPTAFELKRLGFSPAPMATDIFVTYLDGNLEAQADGAPWVFSNGYRDIQLMR